MIYIGFFLLFVLLVSVSIYASPNPIIMKESVVMVRLDICFMVLTSRLIRMEWGGTERLNNIASFGITNRKLPAPELIVSKDKKWNIIRANEIEVSCRLNSGKFNAEKLITTSLNDKENFPWRLGLKHKQKWERTTSTSDKAADTKGRSIKLKDGTLSSDGIAENLDGVDPNDIEGVSTLKETASSTIIDRDRQMVSYWLRRNLQRKGE